MISLLKIKTPDLKQDESHSQNKGLHPKQDEGPAIIIPPISHTDICYSSNGESRHSLLHLSACNSEVIFCMELSHRTSTVTGSLCLLLRTYSLHLSLYYVHLLPI